MSPVAFYLLLFLPTIVIFFAFTFFLEAIGRGVTVRSVVRRSLRIQKNFFQGRMPLGNPRDYSLLLVGSAYILRLLGVLFVVVSVIVFYYIVQNQA